MKTSAPDAVESSRPKIKKKMKSKDRIRVSSSSLISPISSRLRRRKKMSKEKRLKRRRSEAPENSSHAPVVLSPSLEKSPSQSPRRSPPSSASPPVVSLSPSSGDCDLSDLLTTGTPLEVHERCAQFRLRRTHQEDSDPDHFQPLVAPYSDKFITPEAEERYSVLIARKLIDMRFLESGNASSLGAETILANSPWLPTVTVVGRYIHEVVCEFYANLLEIEKRDFGRTYVYVRGHLLEFSPEFIHEVLGIPDIQYLEDEPIVVVPPGGQMRESIELVSGGLVGTWSALAAKHFSPDMAVLYKACCHNWLPTTNSSALKKERVVLLNMIAKAVPFSMGKLIYDQVMSLGRLCCAEKTPFGCYTRI